MIIYKNKVYLENLHDCLHDGVSHFGGALFGEQPSPLRKTIRSFLGTLHVDCPPEAKKETRKRQPLPKKKLRIIVT